MSGNRVKSTKLAEEAKPSADPKAKAGAGTAPEADDEEEGDDAESDENPLVTGLTPMEVAAGQRRSGKKRAAPVVPDIPKGHEAILTSPRKFGIWISGALHEFQKGRTPLTDEQHDAAHMDSYVRDNGASVSYRPKVNKAKAK